MTFWTYLLRCSDGTFYCGHTDDLDRRYAQHRTGATGGYTFKRRPVELAWSQEFPDRIAALEAERQIKGWSRAKKEALTVGDWDEISRLSGTRPSTSSGLTALGGAVV